MNYPFYGYEMPGLQLGQSNWATSTQPAASNVSTINNASAYNSLGLNPNGSYGNYNFGTELQFSQPQGFMGQANNWLSNNADLLKAGVGLVTSGIGAWNGFQQNKLMRENMSMQASQFREQMDISKQNLNRNIEDRQRARVASNPQAYESVQDYMKKYGVK